MKVTKLFLSIISSCYYDCETLSLPHYSVIGWNLCEYDECVPRSLSHLMRLRLRRTSDLPRALHPTHTPTSEQEAQDHVMILLGESFWTLWPMMPTSTVASNAMWVYIERCLIFSSVAPSWFIEDQKNPFSFFHLNETYDIINWWTYLNW